MKTFTLSGKEFAARLPGQSRTQQRFSNATESYLRTTSAQATTKRTGSGAAADLRYAGQGHPGNPFPGGLRITAARHAIRRELTLPPQVTTGVQAHYAACDRHPIDAAARCASTWLPPGRNSGAWNSIPMPDSTAGRSLSGMRKGLSPIAWAGSNANPVSNRPANVEPVQAANQASLPADKAEQLGAGNSWLVSPGTGVPGYQARQG